MIVIVDQQNYSQFVTQNITEVYKLEIRTRNFDFGFFDRLPNLKLLIMNDLDLETIPNNLPKSLKFLSLRNNKISKIKSNTLPENLTHLILCQNRITDIEDVIFPKNLKLLMLNNNYLEYLSFNNISNNVNYLSATGNQIVLIDFSNINFEHRIAILFDRNFIRMIIYNREVLNLNQFQNRIQNSKIKIHVSNSNLKLDSESPIAVQIFDVNPLPQIPNDPQNIHNRTINETTKKSIIEINHRAKLIDNYPNPLLDDILNLRAKTEIIKRLKYNNSNYHSGFKTDYYSLFISIWKLIHNNNEIKKVLNNEIIGSIGLCFSGSLIRLVNSLVDFLILLISKLMMKID